MSQEPSNVTEARAAEAGTADAVEAVVARLKANRANTLALCACLAVCETRMPYREAEALIDERPELSLSMQNAHTLLWIMVECGGIEAVEVPETNVPEVNASDAPADPAALEDQPVDYLVQTTDAGRAALERFAPAKRFAAVLAAEPAAYAPVYALVLDRCRAGASKADIERALEGNEALHHPKQVYPSYFISKLETVGGLAWNGSWTTTEAGCRMLAMIG